MDNIVGTIVFTEDTEISIHEADMGIHISYLIPEGAYDLCSSLLFAEGGLMSSMNIIVQFTVLGGTVTKDYVNSAYTPAKAEMTLNVPASAAANKEVSESIFKGAYIHLHKDHIEVKEEKEKLGDQEVNVFKYSFARNKEVEEKIQRLVLEH